MYNDVVRDAIGIWRKIHLQEAFDLIDEVVGGSHCKGLGQLGFTGHSSVHRISLHTSTQLFAVEMSTMDIENIYSCHKSE